MTHVHHILERLDNIPMELAFWNTNGAENYERLRPLSYPGAHVVLICFTAGSASDRDEVRLKWVPEVKHHCHDIPIILVGFEPEAGDMSDSQQDLDLAKEIGAIAYVQFNTETGAGANDAREAVGLRFPTWGTANDLN
jgi:small GTP-binding protein